MKHLEQLLDTITCFEYKAKAVSLIYRQLPRACCCSYQEMSIVKVSCSDINIMQIVFDDGKMAGINRGVEVIQGCMGSWYATER